ncbi:biopolymer transporter ExbD [Flavobacteriaceae bacterium GF1]
MSPIKRNNPTKLPAISTASLPDIVFILLFFFMTVTTIKNQNLLVENQLPMANEVDKLDKTDRIIEIFVGPVSPNYSNGDNAPIKIQIEDRLVAINEVGYCSLKALGAMPEHLQSSAMVSIKADNKVKMGVITDLKKELQKVNLLKINYTTVEGNVFKNTELK